MQTIVTMTSWSGRIEHVGSSIFRFFKTQTKLPDIFYLWLSEEEFPNKENDLPKDLLLTIKFFNVKLEWLPFNDRNFKRWYVYPRHYFDLVISIDDDILFDKTLVEEAEKHKNEKNIVYNIFKDLTFEYSFSKRIYTYDLKEKESIKYVWLGCSVVCPETFPLDAISYENSEIRRKICKYCDESWLKPFSLMNNTKISYLDFIHLNNKKMQDNCTWRKLQKKVNGFQKREYQLYLCLKMYEKHFEKFKDIFKTYEEYYKNMNDLSIDELIKILEK